jgi:hypothetical protein
MFIFTKIRLFWFLLTGHTKVLKESLLLCCGQISSTAEKIGWEGLPSYFSSVLVVFG